MVLVNLSSNSSLKSTTAEGQLHELCMLLQLAEFDTSKNTTRIDNIQVNHNPNIGTFSASFRFDVEQRINETGEIVYYANDYLAGLNFVNGTGGTFKSQTAVGLLMEIAFFCQNLEKQPTKNPSGRDGVSATFSSDDNSFSGSINLPVFVSVDIDGSIKYTVEEYLLN